MVGTSILISGCREDWCFQCMISAFLMGDITHHSLWKEWFLLQNTANAPAMCCVWPSASTRCAVCHIPCIIWLYAQYCCSHQSVLQILGILPRLLGWKASIPPAKLLGFVTMWTSSHILCCSQWDKWCHCTTLFEIHIPYTKCIFQRSYHLYCISPGQVMVCHANRAGLRGRPAG
jgi:hypothetical protein